MIRQTQMQLSATLALERARRSINASRARHSPFTAAIRRPAGQPVLAPESSTINPSLFRALRPQAQNQWMLPYLAAMTPQYVEMLLRGMLFGNHVQGMELFTVMMDSSPELASCVGEYMDGIGKKRVVLEPYRDEDEEPSETALEKEKVVSVALRNMRPKADYDENGLEATIRDIAFARFHGLSVLEVDWSDTHGDGERFLRKSPNVQGLVQCVRSTYWVHPVCYAFDQEGRLGLAVSRTAMRKVGKEAALTRAGYSTASLGGRDQQIMPFPEDNFLIAIANKTGSVFQKSELRSIGWWWVASNFCGDYLMRYAELFGIPLRKATYDPNTPQAVKEEIRSLLQAAGSEPWSMMPKGTEIEFERGGGGTGESPQAFLFKFANEMIRKVVLHQTMSGGAMSAGSGVGKGGMETESTGPKQDCVDAGAHFVSMVFNQQLVPSILKLNYGPDGDMEAPTFKLVDFEIGGLADAQRDASLSQIMDVPDGYLRRKYGVPKPGAGDKLAGQEVGTQGAQAMLQRQQYEDAQAAQAEQARQQAEWIASQQQAQAGAQGDEVDDVPQAEAQREEDDDGSGAVSGRRALRAKIANRRDAGVVAAQVAFARTVAPMTGELKRIAAIADRGERVAAYKDFLARTPELAKRMKDGETLSKVVLSDVESRVKGLKI